MLTLPIILFWSKSQYLIQMSCLNTDSAPQMILKNSIREIDSLLKIGDEKLIDKCNGELSVKYRSIFGAPGGRCFIGIKIF